MRVKTVKKNREYKRGRSALYDKKRKLHSVYYNVEEWDKITQKSSHLDMENGVYIREDSLGYKPVVPDREFRREMMGVRSDIKSLFKVLESLHLTPQKRMEKLTDFGFLQRWINGVKKELDFLDGWIKRV